MSRRQEPKAASLEASIGRVGGAGSRDADTSAPPASTGDGKRGARVLTLSQLGR